jgi:hypothetical protein
MPARKSPRPSLKTLRDQLATFPGALASLDFDPTTGAFKATFHPPAPVAAPMGETVTEDEDEDEEMPDDFRFALEKLGPPNFGGSVS